MPPSKGRRIPDVSLLIAARGVECLNGMVRHRTVPELVTELKIWVPNLMTAAKVAPMVHRSSQRHRVTVWFQTSTHKSIGRAAGWKSSGALVAITTARIGSMARRSRMGEEKSSVRIVQFVVDVCDCRVRNDMSTLNLHRTHDSSGWSRLESKQPWPLLVKFRSRSRSCIRLTFAVLFNDHLGHE
jgi:hypothetical protein